MNPAPDAADLAAKAVDDDAFTRVADGTLIAQTSSRAIITTLIRELNVNPGDRILQIGTGPAYSTALLAHLTGPRDQVTTLDVVPELNRRAGPLLTAHGYPNTRTLTTDGAKGAPEYGPYERIIAWTTPETVPATWTAQAAEAARIVTPINLTDLSKTYAVLTADITNSVLSATDHFTRSAFVEMSEQIATQWLIPPHGIDALHHAVDGAPWWLSAHWLRATSPHTGTALVERLVEELHTGSPLLAEREDPVCFYAWLLATVLKGLTTAGLATPAWQIGHTPARRGLHPPRPTRINLQRRRHHLRSHIDCMGAGIAHGGLHWLGPPAPRDHCRGQRRVDRPRRPHIGGLGVFTRASHPTERTTSTRAAKQTPLPLAELQRRRQLKPRRQD
jgi:protein-L-isoaspartate(D-aspartate) O-methyltransferase